MKTKCYGKGKQFKKIYLIAPRHPENFWSMQGTVDLFGAKTLMPNAALATLMALTPEDVCVEYSLCDENTGRIDFHYKCDLVVVTGSTLHQKRIREICGRFRAAGVKVALGGTHVSLNPDLCEELADHLFIGEAEYTWPEFLHDWACGRAKPVYEQKKHIAMRDSPAPDWSLIHPGDYLNMNVQTSRGCPNRCDFCDVIQYVGREYRTKSVEQILVEVVNAHKLGARTVFFSDDNFLGNKKFTARLLGELIAWNVCQKRPLSFSTQITVEVADDEELLRMFADARFSVLFLGVETVRKESLAEVNKQQNLKHDIYERMRRISRFGIVPFIGLIVGFDHDDETVFTDLYEFIDSTNSPIAGISLLNAPRNTPLYKRLQKEKRIIGDDFSGEWQLGSNIVPKNMSREVLLHNYRKLFMKLYDPEDFSKRCDNWLREIEYFPAIYTNKKSDPKQIAHIFRVIYFLLFEAGPVLRSVFLKNIMRTYSFNPLLMKKVFTLLGQYRHFYDFARKGNW